MRVLVITAFLLTCVWGTAELVKTDDSPTDGPTAWRKIRSESDAAFTINVTLTQGLEYEFMVDYRGDEWSEEVEAMMQDIVVSFDTEALTIEERPGARGIATAHESYKVTKGVVVPAKTVRERIGIRIENLPPDFASAKLEFLVRRNTHDFQRRGPRAITVLLFVLALIVVSLFLVVAFAKRTSTYSESHGDERH